MSHPSPTIPVAGPYRPGAGDDPAKPAARARAVNGTASDRSRAGHPQATGVPAAGGAR